MIWTAVLRAIWKPVAALLAVLGIYLAGRQGASQRAKSDALEGYNETRKKADAADILDDESLAKRWLQSRDPEQR